MSGKLDHIKNPGALMRPAPFWSWNDNLQESELRRQIRDMAEKGWGSYFMHSRVGLVTGYLSDDWMKIVRACCDEALKTGTYAWLYDEDKWPSGFAGGLVPEKNEAFRARMLSLKKTGQADENDTVICSFEYNDENYEICRTVQKFNNPWFNGTCYVDLMNPETVKEFLDCTHEAYRRECGEYFGNAIPGIFTDEPGYAHYTSLDFYQMPWSDYFAGFFKEKKGYEITEHLPELFFDLGDYHKTRFDFFDTASELFKQSFTKQYYDWCEENNLILTGHFMAEDTLWFQAMHCGDVMPQYEYMHWPGIDKLGRSIEQRKGMHQHVQVKQLTSVVDQLEKERAFCEAYGGAGQSSSFMQRKWHGDWLASLGVNFINHHLSLYSMRGERKRDWPPNFYYQQPWWEDEKGIADYQARLCAAISEGKRIADILVIQPISSVFCEYSPLHREFGFANEKIYDEPFSNLSIRLTEEKLDFHYGNETLMSKYASVSGDKIKVGCYEYSCVIVPPSLNLKSSTVKLLENYMNAGGKVIFTGSIPTLVDGTKQHINTSKAEKVSSIEEAIAAAGRVVENRVHVTDRKSGLNAPKVYVHSRNVNGSIRHFFANVDEQREVDIKIELPGANCPMAVFDLSNGNVYKLEINNNSFNVILAPAGSLLVLCGEEALVSDGECPQILGTGAYISDFMQITPKSVISDFDCSILEENVFLLNEFELEMDGRKVYEGPVAAGLHGGYHMVPERMGFKSGESEQTFRGFYHAPEGTPFKATYRFESECDVRDCFASIEVAENLDSITFNGVNVKPLKTRGEMNAFDESKSWKDVNFTKVPLELIKKGINTLVIEGKKVNNITNPNSHSRVKDWNNHLPTEAEEVYICGDFSVNQVTSGKFVISQMSKKVEGKNLTYEGYPFYSGRVSYKCEFDSTGLAGKLYIQLNKADMACANIRVNGIECGTFRWKPYVVEISDAVTNGKNLIEIEMATTLVNLMGPNRCARVKDAIWVTPFMFPSQELYTDEYQLYDFGLHSVGIISI